MYKPRFCIKCKSEFIPNSPKQKYCKQCLNRVCQKCKKIFTVKNPQYFPKFCSSVCYFLDRWGKGRKLKIKCLNCNEDFSAHISEKRKFCKMECRIQWKKNHKSPPSHWKGGRIKYGSHSNYWAVYQPHHPFADSKGYVMEHRLVMEKKIKRFLNFKEVVHHINRNPSDNRIENLQLLNKRQHDKIHTAERHKTQPQFGR